MKHLFFLIAISLILASIFLSYKQFQNFSNYIDRIAEFEKMRGHLTESELEFQKALSYQKSYSLSRKEEYVQAYNESINKYEHMFLSMDKIIEGKNVVLDNYKFLKDSSVDFFQFVHRAFQHTSSSARTNAELMHIQKLQKHFSLCRNELIQKITDEKTQLNLSRKNIIWIMFFGNGLALLILLLWKRNFQEEQRVLLNLTQQLENQQFHLLDAQKKAKVAEKIKDEFLANISHEIRTPLNAITGLSQLVSRTLLNSEQKKYIQGIQDASKSLIDLISEILDFSKVRSKGFELEVSSTNLGTLLTEVQRIFGGQAELKKIELNVQTDSRVQPVLTDPTRLRQVLLNLAGNAIKFTDQGSVNLKMTLLEQSPIDSDEPYQKIRFEVQDSGLGIPKEKQSQIFENFYQADLKIGNKYGGTGLGLAISKMIVEKMGGRIGFESQEGRGTIFWFEIVFTSALTPPSLTAEFSQSPQFQSHNISKAPFSITTHTVSSIAPSVAPSMAPSVAPSMAPSVAPSMAPNTASSIAKVLIIEDNPLNQMVMSGFIKELGLPSQSASSPLEALEILKTNWFDLIFLDLQMPEMDGFETLRQIRTLDLQKVRSSKVIAATAHTSEGYRSRCIEAGFDGFISKPIEIEQLIPMIAPYIDHSVGSINTANLPPSIDSNFPPSTDSNLPPSTDSNLPPSTDSNLPPSTDSNLPPSIDEKRWEKWRKIPSEKGHFLKEMSSVFLETYQMKWEELQSIVLATGNHQANLQEYDLQEFDELSYQKLEDIAHYLKSSCSNLGAPRMTHYFTELEEQARLHRPKEEIHDRIHQIETEFESLLPQLKKIA